MGEKLKGLRQALAACRESNRNLKANNQQLSKILKESDMKGMETVLGLESNYFGGIFDRLGQVSRWLTAIAWYEYPDNSFQALLSSIEDQVVKNHLDSEGVEFAVVAPHEPTPTESPFGTKEDYLRVYIENKVDGVNYDQFEELVIEETLRNLGKLDLSLKQLQSVA